MKQKLGQMVVWQALFQSLNDGIEELIRVGVPIEGCPEMEDIVAVCTEFGVPKGMYEYQIALGKERESAVRRL